MLVSTNLPVTQTDLSVPTLVDALDDLLLSDVREEIEQHGYKATDVLRAVALPFVSLRDQGLASFTVAGVLQSLGRPDQLLQLSCDERIAPVDREALRNVLRSDMWSSVCRKLPAWLLTA